MGQSVASGSEADVGAPADQSSRPRETTERITRIYEARCNIHRVIVRASGRQDLLDDVCRALVEHGGFTMAWIGWHIPETHELVPVADYGDDHATLHDFRIFIDDRIEQLGPSGRAFREQLPCLTNDLLADLHGLPSQEKARQSSLRSAAAFPLRIGSGPCGTLTVYSRNKDYFSEDAKTLLSDTADDICFALGRFASEEALDNAQALARRERMLTEAMTESIPGILYLYDEDGKFLKWNRSFEQVSGYSADEISRMKPMDFFQGQDQQNLGHTVRKVFEDGDGILEASFLTKSGRTIPYYFTGTRVMFNAVRCLIGVGIDISEVKQAQIALETSERHHRTTLERILEGVQIFDFDWRYSYMNQTAERFCRRQREELLGRTLQECWPGIEESDLFKLLYGCMVSREPAQQEVPFSFPDGTEGWYDIRVRAVPEGIFVMSLDITARHAAEMDLHQLNSRLELTVAEQTEDIRIAMLRAEASDRLKSTFLATMSHELRTPLNSIIGFTGILMQELPGPLNPEQRKQLGMVQGSARHLLELVNDVLDISKIEAGELDVYPRAFELRPSVEKIIGLLLPAAGKKGLFLQTRWQSSAREIISDQRRVEQVLLNVIGNGLKFTEQGGVTVTIDDARIADEPMIRIRVSDTGIGIRPEDFENLFLPFRQLDTGLTRQHEGTGLGLAICDRLLRLLGGSISAEAREGGGVIFSILLPVNSGAGS